MFNIFHVICAKYSQKLAIIDSEIEVTYGQLLQLVEMCAKEIEASQCGNVVAFCVTSRLSAIIIMLACVKLNKIMVPIDENLAGNSKQSMLDIAGCNFLITGFNLDTLQLQVQLLDIMSPPINTGDISKEVMSIMFTSGSTGTPKGIYIKYSAVINLLHQPKFFQLDSSDVFATYSSLSFDASTFEIFTPLLNGNTLIILNKLQILNYEALGNILYMNCISILWLTAGLFNSMVLNDQSIGLRVIKKLFVGGDKVDINAAKLFVDLNPQTQLFNCYGPTENTVFSIVASLTKNNLEGDIVPIGVPVHGVQCEIYDENGNRLQEQSSGRLYLSGQGLSLGYINGMDDKSFFAHPEANTGVFYDTGDEVFRNKDGIYYYIERRDQQIKLNGYRVNLDGIVSRCIANGIAKLVAVYYSQQLHGLILVCYSDSKIQAINSNIEIQNSLKKILNPWELPKQICFINQWYLTLNGKVDRKALVAHVETMLTDFVGLEESKNSLDIIIQDMLKINLTNRSVNLFDIGFDSISVAQLVIEIQLNYGVSLNIMDIYEAGTVQKLEDMIHVKCAK